MPASDAPTTAPPTRRHDVDWLRIIAVYLLFVFHVAMVFNPAPFYHIRNGELSFAMLVGAGFISLWHMPLFFLLAGWSACGSLAARGSAGFAKERVLKLWVPLVAGCVLLMPPIKYLELRTGLDANYTGLYVSAALQPSFAAVIPQGLPVMAPFGESFFAFLPTFFTRLERFTWAHLWFIAYLFVFSLLYLPLFRWLRDRGGELAHAPGGWVYLPIVPLALVQVFLRPHWPGLQNLYDDWANVGYYSTYLLAGFLLARYPALEAAVRREWRRALGVALVATLGLLLGVLGVFAAPSVLLAGTAVAGWCFVVALLGAAQRFLQPVTAGLPWLTESAFPVYWLHQSAIVLLGYPLLRLELGIAAKYALLLVASLSATLLVYHFVVRRFAVTRFCVGMKPRASRPPARRLVRPGEPLVGKPRAARY
jgi:peptidoglycan/LPS O-acetylase OafA/YrhL